MYSLRDDAEFAAAHSLAHCGVKCEGLDGRVYRLRTWSRGYAPGGGGKFLGDASLPDTMGVCGISAGMARREREGSASR